MNGYVNIERETPRIYKNIDTWSTINKKLQDKQVGMEVTYRDNLDRQIQTYDRSMKGSKEESEETAMNIPINNFQCKKNHKDNTEKNGRFLSNG